MSGVGGALKGRDTSWKAKVFCSCVLLYLYNYLDGWAALWLTGYTFWGHLLGHLPCECAGYLMS
jgi:hypothetical protein